MCDSELALCLSLITKIVFHQILEIKLVLDAILC